MTETEKLVLYLHLKSQAKDGGLGEVPPLPEVGFAHVEANATSGTSPIQEGDDSLTQEQLDKIAWLNRAFHADKLAQAYAAKARRDRELAQRLTRSQGAGGTAGAGNGTEAALLRLAATEEQLQAKLQRLAHVREEIHDAILTVQDAELEAILIRRYLDYEYVEQIARRMCYDKRTIQRKHKQALDKLVVPQKSCHPMSPQGMV